MVVLTGEGQNLKTSTIPYAKIHEKLINVTTTVDGNTIYFNDNGLVVNKDGKRMSRVHIYITKEIGDEQKTETITIDCLGNITTSKMKDISSTACDVSTPVAEKTDTKNRHECPEGFEYNASIGACDIICNKPGFEAVNGNCAKKCPEHAKHEYERVDVCVCEDGYEFWNEICLKKCPEGTTRDKNDGICKLQGHVCNNKMDLFTFEQSGRWYSSSYAEGFEAFTSSFGFNSPYNGTLFTTARVKASGMCDDGGGRGLFVDGSLTGQRRGTASDLTFTTTKNISAGNHNVRMGFDGDNHCGITGNYVKFTGVLCY